MADSATAVVGAAYALTVLSYLIILSRILLRRLKHEAFKYDDYLMLFSMVLYGIFTAGFNIAAFHGIGLSQTLPQKLKPDGVQYVVIGSKFLLVSRVFYVSYLWTLKACMLIYYFLRLPLRTKELLAIKVTAGVLALGWFICMLAIFLDCMPLKLYWQVLPSAPSCAKAGVEVIVTETTNIATNVLLMAIPLPIILRPVPPTKEQIRLGGMYLVGLIIIVVSFVRMVVVLMDATKQHLLIWGQLECFLATALVNSPVLHGLWQHGYHHARKGKFGRNNCAPEYKLAVREPTSSRDRENRTSALQRTEEQRSDHEEDEQQQPDEELGHDAQRTSSRLSNSIRKSVSKGVSTMKRLSDIVRTSVALGGIHREVEIRQETKVEAPELADNRPEGFDIYCGPPVEPLGHVSTRVFSGYEASGPRKYRYPRFGLFKKRQLETLRGD